MRDISGVCEMITKHQYEAWLNGANLQFRHKDGKCNGTWFKVKNQKAGIFKRDDLEFRSIPRYAMFKNVHLYVYDSGDWEKSSDALRKFARDMSNTGANKPPSDEFHKAGRVDRESNKSISPSMKICLFLIGWSVFSYASIVYILSNW